VNETVVMLVSRRLLQSSPSTPGAATQTQTCVMSVQQSNSAMTSRKRKSVANVFLLCSSLADCCQLLYLIIFCRCFNVDVEVCCDKPNMSLRLGSPICAPKISVFTRLFPKSRWTSFRPPKDIALNFVFRVLSGPDQTCSATCALGEETKKRKKL